MVPCLVNLLISMKLFSRLLVLDESETGWTLFRCSSTGKSNVQ
jgi:hypothetical protein